MKATQLEKLKLDYCHIEEERALAEMEVVRKEKVSTSFWQQIGGLASHRFGDFGRTAATLEGAS